MKLDGYVRVSKVGGRSGDTFISPDAQRDQITRWAALRGVEIIAWHEDLDQSGGKLTRPGLDHMLDRIRRRETGGVAVARIDRLSRAGVADALRLVESIHDQGAQLAVVDLGIDPTTPFGEFALTVLLALARMQRRQISDQWDDATRRAIKRGVHAHAPYGYAKGHDGRLEIDDAEADVIRAVFHMRGQGVAWQQIANRLNAAGTPARQGLWTRRALQTIVANRAYLGEARYGEHVNPAAHDPLVTLDVFEAANTARGMRPARGEAALLSGLVRCAGCRYRMHAAVVGSRRQLVYRCKRQHGGGVCPAPASVERDLLDRLVADRFLARYGDIELGGTIANDTLVGARDAVAEAEAELAAYRDNTKVREMLERLGGSHYAEGLQAKVDAVLDARARLEQARREAVGIDLGSALAVWPELTTPERRRLLTEGIDAVFLRRASVQGRTGGLDPGRVRVFWRGEAPHDLPGPGIRDVPLRPLDW